MSKRKRYRDKRPDWVRDSVCPTCGESMRPLASLTARLSTGPVAESVCCCLRCELIWVVICEAEELPDYGLADRLPGWIRGVDCTEEDCHKVWVSEELQKLLSVESL